MWNFWNRTEKFGEPFSKVIEANLLLYYQQLANIFDNLWNLFDVIEDKSSGGESGEDILNLRAQLLNFVGKTNLSHNA